LNTNRQLISIIVMLAIGLQGSVVAFERQHTMRCCLEACLCTVAAVVTATPQVLNWLGSATPLPQFLSTRFSSRGDSPLIRPPIL
jgi:hypothetical protein